MCTPLLLGIGMGALQIGNTMMEISQANVAAEAGAEAANQAAAYDYQLENLKEQQINQQAALDKFERIRQAQRERSKIIVAAGESGVSGSSPMRQLANALVQAYYDVGITETSRENQILQAEAEKRGTYAQAQSRVNQYKAQVMGPFTSLLKIGSSGVSGFASGYGTGKWMFE